MRVATGRDALASLHCSKMPWKPSVRLLFGFDAFGSAENIRSVYGFAVAAALLLYMECRLCGVAEPGLLDGLLRASPDRRASRDAGPEWRAGQVPWSGAHEATLLQNGCHELRAEKGRVVSGPGVQN